MWGTENLTKRINLKSIQVMVCCFHFWQKCCLRCTTWRDFRALNSAYVYKKVFSPSCRSWKKIKITRHMIKKVRCISNYCSFLPSILYGWKRDQSRNQIKSILYWLGNLFLLMWWCRCMSLYYFIYNNCNYF